VDVVREVIEFIKGKGKESQKTMDGEAGNREQAVCFKAL
jgi:hypothetical protein